MNRFLILSVLLLRFSVPVFTAEPADYEYYQDFNSLGTGILAGQDSWTRVSGDSPEVVAAGYEGKGVGASSWYGASVTRNIPQGKNKVIEFYMKSNSVGDAANTGYFNLMEGSAAVVTFAFRNGYDDLAYYSGSWNSIQTFTAGEWYKIKLVIRSSSMDIYVDDVLKASGAGFERAQVNGIDKINLKIATNNGYAMWWWDLIKVQPDAALPKANPILAVVDIDPDVLNLDSEGKWITAYIELPKHDARDIDVSTVELGGVKAEEKPFEIGDYDSDGIPDLMVKFDRTKIQALLTPGEASLKVTGKLKDGRKFEGSDTVRIIKGGAEK